MRAMQIINEFEKTKRGVYAGAVGYFGFDGNSDSCIALRTVVLKDGKAYVQAGAGVVADSTPEGEYNETVNKAMGMMAAIARAKTSRGTQTMLLVIDNYDSFTYNLVQYFGELGAEMLVKRNDEITLDRNRRAEAGTDLHFARTLHAERSRHFLRCDPRVLDDDAIARRLSRTSMHGPRLWRGCRAGGSAHAWQDIADSASRRGRLCRLPSLSKRPATIRCS